MPNEIQTHPAFPTEQQIEDVCICGMSDMEMDKAIAELAVRSLVSWLDEHNIKPAPGFYDGTLSLTQTDWQSLRIAAGLEEKS